MPTAPTPRQDRSQPVKSAILAAAKMRFLRDGYEATGVRDIAKDAGVNPAIVIRHFGTKEQLFLKSIDAFETWNALLNGPLEHLGEQVARTIFRGRNRGLEIFGTIVRASSKPDIQTHLERVVREALVEPLTNRISDPLRAHIFAAHVVGLMSALTVYKDPHIINADENELVKHYGPSLQLALTGTP